MLWRCPETFDRLQWDVVCGVRVLEIKQINKKKKELGRSVFTKVKSIVGFMLLSIRYQFLFALFFDHLFFIFLHLAFFFSRLSDFLMPSHLMRHYIKSSSWLKNNIWNMKVFGLIFFAPALPLLILLVFWVFHCLFRTFHYFSFSVGRVFGHHRQLNDVKHSLRSSITAS